MQMRRWCHPNDRFLISFMKWFNCYWHIILFDHYLRVRSQNKIIIIGYNEKAPQRLQPFARYNRIHAITKFKISFNVIK